MQDGGAHAVYAYADAHADLNSLISTPAMLPVLKMAVSIFDTANLVRSALFEVFHIL